MRAAAAALGAGLATALALAGCEDILPEPDLERMIEQRSFRSYETAPWFDDRRAMRPPPLGTVARGLILDRPALTEGVAQGRYVEEIPLPVTGASLRRGRDRYETFCAPCHGVDGRSQTAVSRDMQLRRPPVLVDERVRGFPPGRLFQAITTGYGLMPSYAQVLPVPDRWAVVAYLGALQLSRGVPLESLPPAVRRRVQGQLGEEGR